MSNCIQAAFSSGGGGGATVSGAEAVTSATVSTTSTSFVDVTNLTLTKPDITDGKCTSTATFNAYNSTSTSTIFELDDDGTQVALGMTQEDAASANYANLRCTLIDISDADGATLKVRFKVDGGTGVCYQSTSYSIPKLVSFGVG